MAHNRPASSLFPAPSHWESVLNHVTGSGHRAISKCDTNIGKNLCDTAPGLALHDREEEDPLAPPPDDRGTWTLPAQLTGSWPPDV